MFKSLENSWWRRANVRIIIDIWNFFDASLSILGRTKSRNVNGNRSRNFKIRLAEDRINFVTCINIGFCKYNIAFNIFILFINNSFVKILLSIYNTNCDASKRFLNKSLSSNIHFTCWRRKTWQAQIRLTVTFFFGQKHHFVSSFGKFLSRNKSIYFWILGWIWKCNLLIYYTYNCCIICFLFCE